MSYAADTLLHYIKTLWEQTDLHWNSDNQAEVESIVESIESTIENQIKQKLQSTPASQTEQAKQKAKDSQEAVAMFAEYQKQQQNEQRLIVVGTPILVGFLQAQATLYGAALPSIIQETNSAFATKQLEELGLATTHEEMVDEALKLAKLFLEKVKS
jgi:hypothetical protein